MCGKCSAGAGGVRCGENDRRGGRRLPLVTLNVSLLPSPSSLSSSTLTCQPLNTFLLLDVKIMPMLFSHTAGIQAMSGIGLLQAG